MASKPGAAGAKTPAVSSAHLARMAREAIDKDSSIVAPKSLKLKISASGAMVSLAGTAGTIYDREQACRLAEGVAGVRGINPSIRIAPPEKVETGALETAVVEAVKAANVAGATFAARATGDGTVELNGEVTNEWLAVNAVKKVPGVTAIRGYEARNPGMAPPKAEAALTIVPPSPEQDAKLLEAGKDALKNAGMEHIAVAVEKGIAKLTGRAAGMGQALVASRRVAQVSGILGVENRLSISGRAFRLGEYRDGKQVEVDVRRNLRGLAANRGEAYRLTGLEVAVTEGMVILSGRASSEEAAYAAVDAAAAIPGVQEVVNALSYPTLVQGS